MHTLDTSNQNIKLIPPDVERDAPLGVEWLNGSIGHETLRLMGNTDEQNKPSTLEEEKKRVQGFIDSTDQLNWMIQLQDTVVGSIWVDLEDTDYVAAPSIHIMIGDPSARGHKVGTIAGAAVLKFLKDSNKYEYVNSRHLTSNQGSENLLKSAGFIKIGEQYTDADGLRWQNVTLKLVD